MSITDTPAPDIKITAVIVTYNPEVEFLARLIVNLKAQLESIVVIDNASSDQRAIKQVCKGLDGYFLPSNLGLGKAHNIGIEHAESVGSSHVLLLDQDSLPDDDMVKKLVETAQDLEHKDIDYCGIGCRYHLQSSNTDASTFVKIAWLRFARVSCQQQLYTEADFLISSGSLLPIKAIRDIGLMDESLFIDHIDTEWFLRAKDLGYQAYGCCAAFMNHELGERTKTVWFGRKRQVPYHKPFRYYYIFRNSFLLYKRRYMSAKWMLADWARLAQQFIFFVLLSKPRLLNFKMMLSGIADGIKGVAGRNDKWLAKD